jgi:hypothetical protein
VENTHAIRGLLWVVGKHFCRGEWHIPNTTRSAQYPAQSLRSHYSALHDFRAIKSANGFSGRV